MAASAPAPPPNPKPPLSVSKSDAPIFHKEEIEGRITWVRADTDETGGFWTVTIEVGSKGKQSLLVRDLKVAELLREAKRLGQIVTCALEVSEGTKLCVEAQAKVTAPAESSEGRGPVDWMLS